MSIAGLAKEKLRYYREADDGVVRFAREVCNMEPDPWQYDMFITYQTGKPRTCMKACKNPGKTAALAIIAWHFLVVYEDSNVACTSISGDNLRDGLWKELSKWQAKSTFLMAAFQWSAERIVCKERPGHWWASARKWSKTSDATRQSDTLAGLHADFMLFILDETGAMPRAVMAAAEAALGSGKVTRLVQAGNPTSLDGPLYEAFAKDRSMWNIIDVTGDPDNTKRAPRVNIEWARQQIAKYGRENPWVKVNVFGEFPEANINSLFAIEDVNDAMRRHLDNETYRFSQKRLGVDVARYGDDLTVLFPRQGLAAFKPVYMTHRRGDPVSVDIANRVLMAKQRWGWELAFFDDTAGWAHGAIDVLRVNGESPLAMQFHGTSPDPKYANLRAYGWIMMSEWLLAGGALPNVPDLVGELTSATYTYSKGKFILEDKDLIKERIGRSPNYADALATTFMIPDQPTGAMEILGKLAGVDQNRHHAKSDFDPLEQPDEAMQGFDVYEPGRNRI